MSEFIAQIPDLILEQREIKTEREKHDQQLDKIEKAHSELNDSDDDYEQPDILAKSTKLSKGWRFQAKLFVIDMQL
jgi:chaperonin cofactor prefoldin